MGDRCDQDIEAPTISSNATQPKFPVSGRIDAIKTHDREGKEHFYGFAQCGLCFWHYRTQLRSTEAEANEAAQAGLEKHAKDKHASNHT